jgi:hypothetical protein
MRYDEKLTRAATSSSMLDERWVGRKVVKVGVKGKIKSAEFGREGKHRGLFQGQTDHLIAVRAGTQIW